MCVNDKSAVNEGSRTLCENGDTVISCDPVRYLPLILLLTLELRGPLLRTRMYICTTEYSKVVHITVNTLSVHSK